MQENMNRHRKSEMREDILQISEDIENISAELGIAYMPNADITVKFDCFIKGMRKILYSVPKPVEKQYITTIENLTKVLNTKLKSEE